MNRSLTRRRRLKPETKITKDGRVIYSGGAYMAFKARLIAMQGFRCAGCQKPIMMHTSELHHEKETGQPSRGMGGGFRNDQEKSVAIASGQKSWAIALCIPCHRRKSPQWESARLV